MSHFATDRLHLLPAPNGLAFVQDLLNTRDVGGKVPDLLATVDQGRGWLVDVLASRPDGAGQQDWARQLSDRDLASLRALRSDVQNLLTAGDVPASPTLITKVGLSLQPSGQVLLEPTGIGRQWLVSAVWAEIFLAQQLDTWKRLKLCHKLACSSAFYDRSKNNSGVWHDVKICGNAANLRASRARRRECGR